MLQFQGTLRCREIFYSSGVVAWSLLPRKLGRHLFSGFQVCLPVDGAGRAELINGIRCELVGSQNPSRRRNPNRQLSTNISGSGTCATSVQISFHVTAHWLCIPAQTYNNEAYCFLSRFLDYNGIRNGYSTRIVMIFLPQPR